VPRIRVLTSVAGARFSWEPGEEVDVDDATAAVWADGVRAELVADPAARSRRRPVVETMTAPAPENTALR